MSAEDGNMSSARRQRRWLDAIDTKVEAEDRARRAQEALVEAQRDETRKRDAYLKSLDSPSTPE